MSDDELTCPSCRVEIDPISLDRCTGCGLPFSSELQKKLQLVYETPDRGIVIRRTQVTHVSDSADIPVAQVAMRETLVIDAEGGLRLPRQISVREAWSQTLMARVCLRAGIGLAIWSVVVSPLGILAMAPGLLGLFLCLVSLYGSETYWALAGICLSFLSLGVVAYVQQIQAFH